MSLRGFVSLRTNEIWTYFDGTARAAKISPTFYPVKTNVKLEAIRGTCYNILIPVSV
jgi:hypothetical protein